MNPTRSAPCVTPPAERCAFARLVVGTTGDMPLAPLRFVERFSPDARYGKPPNRVRPVVVGPTAHFLLTPVWCGAALRLVRDLTQSFWASPR